MLDWFRQGIDHAGEIWVCRGGWIRGREESWSWGKWGAKQHTNGLVGTGRQGETMGFAKSKEDAQAQVESFYAPEMATQVERLLLAEEGYCVKCMEFKPLQGSKCFTCAG